MADDSDNRSSRQDTEGSSQGSSKGTPISFDVEGDGPAIVNRPMTNAHRKPPDPSQF
jgi:hypothetical protein